MASFNDSIKKMLWPEKRKGNIQYQTASGKMLPGWIDRTSATSYLRVPSGYVPPLLEKLVGKIKHGSLVDEQGIELGPIPKGTPVNLLSNIDLDRRDGIIDRAKHKLELLELLVRLKIDLKKLPDNPTDQQAAEVFADLVDPLVKASKCPDYIVNRGHYFGTDYFKDKDEPGLSDDDKLALIAFLKTM